MAVLFMESRAVATSCPSINRLGAIHFRAAIACLTSSVAVTGHCREHDGDDPQHDVAAKTVQNRTN